MLIPTTVAMLDDFVDRVFRENVIHNRGRAVERAMVIAGMRLAVAIATDDDTDGLQGSIRNINAVADSLEGK